MIHFGRKSVSLQSDQGHAESSSVVGLTTYQPRLTPPQDLWEEAAAGRHTARRGGARIEAERVQECGGGVEWE
jgi:hypothetical protein